MQPRHATFEQDDGGEIPPRTPVDQHSSSGAGSRQQRRSDEGEGDDGRRNSHFGTRATASNPAAGTASDGAGIGSHMPTPSKPFGPGSADWASDGILNTHAHEWQHGRWRRQQRDGQEVSTHAVNTAYSRRLVVGGDRALVVHFTHNPHQNLAPSEQLLSVARVAIPALCNYLYFRAGRLAVVYFGKTRSPGGQKVGVVGGEDMKNRLLRFLTVEIWPPLRTDVPDDSGEHHTGGGNAAAVRGGGGDVEVGVDADNAAAAAMEAAAAASADPMDMAATLEAQPDDGDAAAAGEMRREESDVPDPASPAGPPAAADRFDAATRAASASRRRWLAPNNDDDDASRRAAPKKPQTATTAVRRVVLPMPTGENGRGMQVLVYLKPGARGTHYLKLVLSNIEKLHFDVVDTREEKHRWENRKLHIRMLDSLETQKAIFSYAEYEHALREACKFATEHRDDDAEATIVECDEAVRNVAGASGDDGNIGGGGGESPAMGPSISPCTSPAVASVASAAGLSFGEKLAHLLGPATTPLMYALRHYGSGANMSRPLTPSVAGSFARSPAMVGGARAGPSSAGLGGFSLGPSASGGNKLVDSPASTGPQPEPGRVHCVVVRDHHYQFYQPMHLPESATLDYKSYFFNTAKEIQDRAVKFMCGFLNAYGHGKLVVGVHEIRGAGDTSSSSAGGGAMSGKKSPSSSAASAAALPRDGRAVKAQLKVEAAIDSMAPEDCGSPASPADDAAAAAAGRTSPTNIHRTEPDQLVVGASLSAEEVADLVNDLSVQLAHCVPPIPPEIVHINLVPVRLPEIAAAGAATSGAKPADDPRGSDLSEIERLTSAMGARTASLPTPPAAATPGTAKPTAAAASGLFPDMGGAESGIGGPPRSPTTQQAPRQRVLVFFEPPSASWWNTFQQKANFAVRVLAKHGFSLVPIDLPVPRLPPPAACPDAVPPRDAIEAPSPMARHRGSVGDLHSLGAAAASAAAPPTGDGGDGPEDFPAEPPATTTTTTTTGSAAPGEARFPAAAGAPHDEAAAAPEPPATTAAEDMAATAQGGDADAPRGPLHGVIHPIPADWYAQCYAIVPFAPNAQAAAAIFAAEAGATSGNEESGTETGAKSAASAAAEPSGGTKDRKSKLGAAAAAPAGTSDVVEVIDSSGVWSPYDEINSRIVSMAKARGDKSVTVRVSRREYTIDLTTMIQTNKKTNKNRQIRVRRFGGVSHASDDGKTLADHELDVMRGLSQQKTQRQCIVWADGAALPDLFIIDISVDLRRLPADHSLRAYRGKFFNGWPSVPMWDPLSHCVRRAPRNYQLLLQRRQTLAGILPGAQRDWFSVPSVCAAVAAFVPRASQRALRLASRGISDAVDAAWGRDVVQELCTDATALMRDAVVAVPFDAIRAAQAALRREYGHPNHGGTAHASAAMARRYLAHRLAQQGIGSAAVVPGRKAQRRARRHMLHPHAGPGTLPLMLCWVYESIGALPAPYPHVPVPLQLQHVRVAPHLVTLFMMPSAWNAHWSLVPSLVLDLNDGLVKFFLPDVFTHASSSSPTGAPAPLHHHQQGSAAAAAMHQQQGMGSRLGSASSAGMAGGPGGSTSSGSSGAPCSTEQLLAALRVVCGAVCDGHTPARQLAGHHAAAAAHHLSATGGGGGGGMSSRSSSGLMGPIAATDSSSNHRAGRPAAPVGFGGASASSSVPVPLVFVDATVALREAPWRLDTVIVWLQLVAKDPLTRHHGAPTSGSTVALVCDLVRDCCAQHASVPVVQSRVPYMPASGGTMGGSQSLGPSPQPTQPGAGSGGAFPRLPSDDAPATAMTTPQSLVPVVALTPPPLGPHGTLAAAGTAPALGPPATTTTLQASAPPSVRTPTTPMLSAGPSPTARKARFEFPSAPEFNVRLGTTTQQQHNPAAAGTAPNSASASPATGAWGFTSTFDCPLHRAEAEWAMWGQERS